MNACTNVYLHSNYKCNLFIYFLVNCEFSEQFLRFLDSPIHLDMTWSRMSCPEPEVLQIWPLNRLSLKGNCSVYFTGGF